MKHLDGLMPRLVARDLPMQFPEAYYSTLAQVVPVLWIGLIIEFRIASRPFAKWPGRTVLISPSGKTAEADSGEQVEFHDPFSFIFGIVVRLVGVLGLPALGAAVLIGLRRQEVVPFVEDYADPILLVGAGIIVLDQVERLIEAIDASTGSKLGRVRLSRVFAWLQAAIVAVTTLGILLGGWFS
jgi:hypothetical protein